MIFLSIIDDLYTLICHLHLKSSQRIGLFIYIFYIYIYIVLRHNIAFFKSLLVEVICVKPGPLVRCFYRQFASDSTQVACSRSDSIGLRLGGYLYIVVGLGIGRVR